MARPQPLRRLPRSLALVAGLVPTLTLALVTAARAQTIDLTPVISSVGDPVRFASAADTDDDGDLDLVLSQGSRVAFFTNDGTGAFTLGTEFSLPSGGPIASGDLNGDGRPDFVSVGYIGPIYSFLSSTTGDYTLLERSLLTATMALELADLDQDGLLDLIIAGYSFTTGTGRVETYRGTGSGEFVPAGGVDLPGIPVDVDVADFTGDGILDAVVSESTGVPISLPPAYPAFPATDGTLTILPGDGLGGVSLGTIASAPFGLFEVADVNQDGALDVVGTNVNASPCSAGILVALGGGTGGFSSVTDVALACAIDGLALADLDGDTVIDLVGTDLTSGLTYVALGEGTGAFTVDNQIAVNLGSRPLIGDFDDDGDLDPLVFGQDSSQAGTAVFLQATGGAFAGSFVRGDINLDSNFDISDAVFALAALFVPGSPSPSCPDAADANDDGGFDVSDAVFALAALFVPGAPPLPEPQGTCGPDPTADALDCPAACP